MRCGGGRTRTSRRWSIWVQVEQSSENLKDDLRVNPPYMGPEGDTRTPPPTQRGYHIDRTHHIRLLLKVADTPSRFHVIPRGRSLYLPHIYGCGNPIPILLGPHHLGDEPLGESHLGPRGVPTGLPHLRWIRGPHIWRTRVPDKEEDSRTPPHPVR